MSDDAVDLRFIARQLKFLTEEFGSFKDDLNVLTAMVMRIDGTMSATLNELRAMHSQHSRLANRVHALEAAAANEERSP